MTKLDELEAAYDAAYDAAWDAAGPAHVAIWDGAAWDVRDSRATVVAVDAWAVYAAALKAAWAALDAYKAELKKTQEENSND
jgi:hypothetical protein